MGGAPGAVPRYVCQRSGSAAGLVSSTAGARKAQVCAQAEWSVSQRPSPVLFTHAPQPCPLRSSCIWKCTTTGIPSQMWPHPQVWTVCCVGLSPRPCPGQTWGLVGRSFPSSRTGSASSPCMTSGGLTPRCDLVPYKVGPVAAIEQSHFLAVKSLHPSWTLNTTLSAQSKN